MKKYKPKKWFIYTRLVSAFLIIFTFGRGTNVVYNKVTTTNNHETKMLSQAIILDNKEEIYVDENPVLNKYMNLPEKGFEVTIDNKKYEMSEEDYNLLVSVVAAEASNSIDDTLAVMSVILNRADKRNLTPVEVVTAPGQFAGYFNYHYLNYLNEDGSLRDVTKVNAIKDVGNDALNGVRNNNYYGFRSWGTTSYSDNYIVEKGNRYN